MQSIVYLGFISRLDWQVEEKRARDLVESHDGLWVSDGRMVESREISEDTVSLMVEERTWTEVTEPLIQTSSQPLTCNM